MQVTDITKQFILCLIFMADHLQARADTHVIYGEDDRVDFTEISSPYLREVGESVAAQIPRSFLKPKNMGQEFLVDGRFLGKAHNLCPNERYFYDVSAAECSSFLIEKDQIITAGHCVPYLTESCREFVWVFAWTNERLEGAKPLVLAEDVYGCKKIEKRVIKNNLDYAIIRLDRVVEGRDPLKWRTSGEMDSATQFTVLGYPSGIPLKATFNASLLENSHPSLFRIDADLFTGNSGSPVLNESLGLVEGIVISGEDDYEYDVANECWHVKVCLPGSHCQGEGVTRISAIPELAKLVNQNF